MSYNLYFKDIRTKYITSLSHIKIHNLSHSRKQIKDEQKDEDKFILEVVKGSIPYQRLKHKFFYLSTTEESSRLTHDKTVWVIRRPLLRFFVKREGLETFILYKANPLDVIEYTNGEPLSR